MDKKPISLVSADEGCGTIIIYEDDSETMKKLKMFMAHYGVVDIKMRMLSIKELKKIQGFNKSYILKGTQTNQKKFIGNSVCPKIPKKMIEALYVANLQKLKKAA
jgi:DNA (cytosine-5)-methyltransferase 1